ncbi:MAG: hypothetical protein IK089_03030 [Oxalobacter sp.]|nr:hypothetical protein [Oxalobacter sp.]
MNRIPARTGWEWIQAGFTIFKKRPFFLVNLLFLYMMSVVLVTMVPMIGQMLPVFTIAIFTFIFMTATLMVEQEQPLTFGALFAALDKVTLFRLFALSGCYIVFGMIVAGISTVLDDGALFALVMSREGVPQLTDEQMTRAGYMALAIIVLYIPFFMLTWFAAPLIGWRQMGVPKAMFYSFFTVAHNWRPFLVYVLGFAVVGFIIPTLVGGIIGPMLGGVVGAFVLYIISVTVTTVLYCSFYPTYRSIFGIPVLGE